MDPLSIATGVVTLAAVISSAIQKAQSLHEAPIEILAVSNEVTDLHVVVQEVVRAWETIEKDKNNAGTGESLASILSRAQKKLLELDTLLKRVLTRDPTNNKTKYGKLAWLRVKSRVDVIRQELIAIKLSLGNVLEASTLVSISRLHLRLDEIALVNSDKSISSQIFSDENSRNPGSEDDHRRRENRDQEVEMITDRKDAISEKQAIQAVTRENHSRIIQLKASRSECSKWCSCVCHKPHRLNSPRLLTEVFGAMSINYSGVPYFSSPCNEKKCKPRPSSAQVTYQFPSWMVTRVISMLLSSRTAGPELQLRTMRIVPPNSDIFRLAINGDILGMQTLFKNGAASIYDIDNRRWSIFHKAFVNGQNKVCRFLLEQGADPAFEASNGSSAVERAWHFDRTNSSNDPIIFDILKAPDAEELAESQQYTTVHKIVLGLSQLDLESQLQLSTSTIDDIDTRGRTALWWASARGDEDTVRTLLQYGATVAYPKIPDRHSALHVAQTPQVVRLLLEYGAYIDSKDEAGRTPLHCCSYRGASRGGSIELLESLLEGGANITATSAAGHTPLHYTAMYGFTDHMALLLGRGAPIDGRKPNGYTPLFDSIRCCQPSALKLLLSSGADCGLQSRDGQTIVHVAAAHGDIPTLNVLAASNISGIDVDAKDSLGRTPWQCLEGRQDQFEDLRRAFEDLLDALSERTDQAVRIASDSDSDPDNENDEADVFEDAVENPG